MRTQVRPGPVRKSAMKHRIRLNGRALAGALAAAFLLLSAAGVHGQRQIRPQRKPEFSGIAEGAAGLMIVLRHTGIGWGEAYGFDTIVYRFFGDPDAGYSEATLCELHPGGERIAVRYRFVHGARETVILASRVVKGTFGPEVPESAIGSDDGSPEGSETGKDIGRFLVSGRQARIVRLDESGRVTFSAPDGSYEEKYPFGFPATLEDACRDPWIVSKTRDGKAVAAGRFLTPWPGVGADGPGLRYAERKPVDTMGAETIEAGFWDEAGATLFCVEGVEPLAEGYIKGFPAFSCSKAWLANLALIDAVAGEGGILRLAYMAANTFQSVSSSGGVAVSSSRTPVLGWGRDNFHEWSIILPDAELRRAPYLRSPLMGHPIAAN